MTLTTTKTLKRSIPAVKAFDMLEKEAMIRPGQIIPRSVLEKCFNMKYLGNENNMKFMGHVIILQSLIKSRGFFVTSAGIEDPGFRILESEEMADHCTKKLHRNLASNFELSLIMAAHDTSKMDEKDLKKHKLAQNQAAQTALIQQKMLFSNEMF